MMSSIMDIREEVVKREEGEGGVTMTMTDK
jgi:hypothetical protein